MKLEVHGIIIKEKDLNECDKVITILTAEKGVITVIAKHSKTYRNRLGGMMQLLTYAAYVLYEGKYGYILNSIEVKETFSKLRNNIKDLSLAQYFCELSLLLRPEESVSEEILRVFLNCLFYLSHKKMDCILLKSIFELKVCSLCGYMPELISCNKCKTYESDTMNFLIKQGKLFCKNCTSNDEDFCITLNPTLLTALRHIVYSPLENLFKFSVLSETAKSLNLITEKYVRYHVSEKFKSLEFFYLF